MGRTDGCPTANGAVMTEPSHENGSAAPRPPATDPVQRQVNLLRDQKRNLDRQAAELSTQNQKLVRLLNASRQEIVSLKKTLAGEAEPPATYAVVLQVNPWSRAPRWTCWPPGAGCAWP